MGFDPRNSANESSGEHRGSNQSLQLDPETVKRIDYALKGTMDVDISGISLDDKLTLLIERYNRKTRELQQLKTTKSE